MRTPDLGAELEAELEHERHVESLVRYAFQTFGEIAVVRAASINAKTPR
jgi:hypothetical protein